MSLRRISTLIVLGALASAGCGDDSSDGSAASGDASAATASDAAAQRSDATTPPVADAGMGARDASAVVSDGGATVLDGGAVDSGSSAADASTSSTGESSACLSCTTTQCTPSKWPNADPARFKTCADFKDEKATGGQKTGTLRSQLCQGVVDCLARTKCSNSLVPTDADGGVMLVDDILPNLGGTACLCGTDKECSSIGKAEDFAGQCAGEIIDALETIDATQILERLKDPAFPAGVVFQRYECQASVCADECFMPCTGQPDGKICNGRGRRGSTDSSAGVCKSMMCTDDPTPLEG